MIEEQTQRPKVSEVDRAYQQHIPDAHPWWTYGITIAFIAAIVGLSFIPDYSAIPDSLRAVLLTSTDATAQSN